MFLDPEAGLRVLAIQIDQFPSIDGTPDLNS
jgi:hypothetical protein